MKLLTLEGGYVARVNIDPRYHIAVVQLNSCAETLFSTKVVKNTTSLKDAFARPETMRFIITAELKARDMLRARDRNIALHP